MLHIAIQLYRAVGNICTKSVHRIDVRFATQCSTLEGLSSPTLAFSCEPLRLAKELRTMEVSRPTEAKKAF